MAVVLLLSQELLLRQEVIAAPLAETAAAIPLSPPGVLPAWIAVSDASPALLRAIAPTQVPRRARCRRHAGLQAD